jgi:excisionase family DNA binding protein
MQQSILLQNVSPEQLTELINNGIKTHLEPFLKTPIIQNETLLSKKEVLELLGITMNTLDKHIKNGTIPAYGLGARLMFKKDEVLASLTRIN